MPSHHGDGAKQPHSDNVPVRRLRERRDSAPVPTELVDAANPLAVAFHVSATLAADGATTPKSLATFWGAGRPLTKRAKDVLVEHGLWIEVRRLLPNGGWGYEIRTVETRVTDRDLIELAMECPAGTRIRTAGKTWRIGANGDLTTGSGREVQTLTTETCRQDDVSAGQDLTTGTCREVQTLTTETCRQDDVSAGQDLTTGTCREAGDPLIEEGNFVPEGKNEVPSFKEGEPARLRGAGGLAREDDELTAEVRRLAHRLPWSKTTGRTAETMRQVDALLVPAMVSAIRDLGLTFEAAQEHALHTLAGGKVETVGFVAGAFEARRIPMPVPDDELPLPAFGASANPSEIDRNGSNGVGETNEANRDQGIPQKRSQPVSDDALDTDASADLDAAREVLADLAVPGYTAKPNHLGTVTAAIAEHGRDRVEAHLRDVLASAGDPLTRLGMALPNLLVALNDAANSN